MNRRNGSMTLNSPDQAKEVLRGVLPKKGNSKSRTYLTASQIAKAWNRNRKTGKVSPISLGVQLSNAKGVRVSDTIVNKHRTRTYSL